MTRGADSGKKPEKTERSDRLAAALRANLRRRKEQERSRGAADRKNPAVGKDQDR